MFRIIYYIFIFILIMLGLFFLHKNNVWFENKIKDTKIFFKSIAENKNASTDSIYKNINSRDFVGGLGATSSINTTNVKSFTKENLNKNTNINTKQKEQEQDESKISIDGIIYYTNLERLSAGLKPLVKNSKLDNSATLKIDDMFADQYFEHMSPDGKTAADLIKSFDYKFQIVGENLALGVFQNDKNLVQAWMNSPSHRANILNPKYTEIGVSVGIGDYKGQKQWLAVQHFAKPIPLCNEIDQVVQNDINNEKKALEDDEIELQKRAGFIESNPSVTKEYIDNYNNMVNNYNERLNKLRVTINNFNETIVNYNNCVKS